VTPAPNLTEIAFALGLGDRVVGVGDYVRWPPAAADRPRLGGLLNPNLERIVALKPDLALLLPSERDMAGRLQALGIEILIVPIESIDDLSAGVLAVARHCGVEAAGQALAERLRRQLAPRRQASGQRVLLTAGRSPGRPAELLVAGPGTFLDELLGRLGAVNVFQDAAVLYPQVSLEVVLDRKPEVILELRAEDLTPDEVERLRQDWQAYPEIPAVRAGAIHVVTGDWTLIPGPRLPRLYQAMAAALDGSPEASPP
jgi:iron complex transport system substrate-binding protein